MSSATFTMQPLKAHLFILFLTKLRPIGTEAALWEPVPAPPRAGGGANQPGNSGATNVEGILMCEISNN